MRPVDFVSTPGDGDYGWEAEPGVLVSGHDPQHLSANFLYTLALKPSGYASVPSPIGESIDAAKAAQIAFKYLIEGVAGQVRKDGPYMTAERGVGRVIQVAIQSVKLGVIKVEDLAVLFNYFQTVVLPFFEKAPGLCIMKASQKEKPLNLPPITGNQVYGFVWQWGILAPNLFDLANLLPQGLLRDRTIALAKRFCQYVADAVTDDGKTPFAIIWDKIPQDQVQNSIAPYCDDESRSYEVYGKPDYYSYTPWVYRALSCGSHLSCEGSEPKRDQALERIKEGASGYKASELKQWVVNANGEYDL